MNERKTIFRGKRKDNGEWVYGFYLELRACDGIFHLIVDEDGEYYKINPKTRGEFTGLYDKNDKKIFEGDIVEFQFDNDGCPFPDKNTKKRTGKVYFEKFRASFAIAMGRNGSSVLNNNLFRYVQNGNRVSVIGNIHDNPGLLEGEENE